MVPGRLLLPLFAVVAAGVLGQGNQPTFVPGSYVVELDDATEAITDFASRLHSLGDTQRSFDYPLFRGLSLKLRETGTAKEDVAKLADLPGVKNVWPNRVHYLPQDNVVWKGQAPGVHPSLLKHAKPRQVDGDDTYTPHVMTQVNQLRERGVIGEGVKVALVDTGVDYNHPALGGCFGDGCLVTFGTDLVGDDYNGTNTATPDDDPHENCNGHGTHVSGIVAAQTNDYGFTGAAPGVSLGMYRAIGCTGGASTDVLIDAYMQAFEDGAQVISASIAATSGWSEDAWAVAVSRIVEAGVPCTIAAGNFGSMGLFYGSTAASGNGVIAVASINNEVNSLQLTRSYYQSGDDTEQQSFGYQAGNPDGWANVTLPVWAPTDNITSPEAEGCEPFPEETEDLTNYIVLLRHSGNCASIQAALNAADVGARYIMFYNDADTGISSPETSGVPGLLASGMVTREQGVDWMDAWVNGTKVVLEMLDPATAPYELVVEPNTATGGYVSEFSSWGPNFEMQVKPQVAAPGGAILSTYPVSMGSFAVLDGTSMATPFVAAILALIYNVRGSLDPAFLDTLLSTNANPQLLNDGATTTDGMLAPVAQQGAGIIRAYDAAYSSTIISRSSLAFNDSANLIETLNFTVTNMGGQDVTFNLGNVGAATAYTFPNSTADVAIPDAFPGIEFPDAKAEIEFSSDSITVPGGGGEVVVSVTVTPPPGLDASRIPVYSGYITLNSTSEEEPQSLSLPYNGVGGSLNEVPVLYSAYIVSSESPSNPIEAETEFVLPGPRSNYTAEAEPIVTAQLSFGIPEFTIEVLQLPNTTTSAATTTPASRHRRRQQLEEEAEDAKNLGRIYEMPMLWMPRDTYTVTWDGMLWDGSYVPAGRYMLRVKGLRVFGRREDPEQWTVVDSEPFRLRFM